MAGRGHPSTALTGDRGQASLLFLGALGALLAGVLVLFGFGQALGARSKHQRAADLAAVSAAQVMSRNYARLFEPAVFENGLPNPRHLSSEAYLALARAAALRDARRNGVPTRGVTVSFPGEGFAPTRIEVRASGDARLRVGERREASRSRRAPRRRSHPASALGSGCQRTAPATVMTARWPTGWES